MIVFTLRDNVYLFYRLHSYRYYVIFDPLENFIVIIVVFFLKLGKWPNDFPSQEVAKLQHDLLTMIELSDSRQII